MQTSLETLQKDIVICPKDIVICPKDIVIYPKDIVIYPEDKLPSEKKQWKERVNYARKMLAMSHSPSLRSWTGLQKQLEEALQEEWLVRCRYRECQRTGMRNGELTRVGNQWRQACIKTNQVIETDQERRDRLLYEAKRKTFWEEAIICNDSL